MGREAESQPGADIVWDPSVPPLSRTGDSAVGRARSRPQPQLPACHRQEISWQKAGAGTEGSWRLTGGGTQRAEKGRGRGRGAMQMAAPTPASDEEPEEEGPRLAQTKPTAGGFSAPGGRHRSQDPVQEDGRRRRVPQSNALGVPLAL